MLRRFTSWLSEILGLSGAEWWFETDWEAIEFEKEANRAVGSPIAPIYDAVISERVRRDFEPVEDSRRRLSERRRISDV